MFMQGVNSSRLQVSNDVCNLYDTFICNYVKNLFLTSASKSAMSFRSLPSRQKLFITCAYMLIMWKDFANK